MTNTVVYVVVLQDIELQLIMVVVDGDVGVVGVVVDCNKEGFVVVVVVGNYLVMN